MSRDSRPASRGDASRKDRTRPIELVGLAAVFGVFSGLVVGLATREWILAAEFFGIIFIVSLVVLAMLMVGQPKADDPGADSRAPRDRDDEPRGH
jgi:hypothetical protein